MDHYIASNLSYYVKTLNFVSMFYGLSVVQYQGMNQITSSFAEMSLAAVPVDTVTEERNGKRPCGNRKTKTGEKWAHEKPSQGNGVARTTYQWPDPHCSVYTTVPMGKGPMGLEYRMQSS